VREQGGKRAGSWSQELAVRTRVLREGLTIHGHRRCEVWCSVDCTVSIAFGSAQVTRDSEKSHPSGVEGHKADCRVFWQEVLEGELWATEPHTIPTWPTGLCTDAQREAKPGGSAFLRCFENAFESGKGREKEKQSN